MANWTTSTTMMTCKTGHATLSMQEQAFPIGQRIRMVTCSPPFVYMEGIICSASGENTSVEIDIAHGDDKVPCGPWFVMVAGEPGTQGPAGSTGEIGLQGPQGPIGQGPQGLPGAEGQRGVQGPTGIQGATGAIGPAGPIGPSGLDGKDGAQGPQGPQGEIGSSGKDGQPGNDGVQGAQGHQGHQGDVGPEGNVGPQGEPGKTFLSQLPQAGHILMTYLGVSKTKQEIGKGIKVFVIQRQEDVRFAYATGTRLRASRPFITGQWMEGQVVYYVPGSLEVAIMCDLCSGNGSYDNWVINLAGEPTKETTWGLSYTTSEQSGDGKICIASIESLLTISIGKLDHNGQDASAYITSMAGQRMYITWEGGMVAYLMGDNPVVDDTTVVRFNGSCSRIYGNDPAFNALVRIS